MNDVLIDVGRLVGRQLKGRLPTGVDRVGLAYVAHFAGRARALVQLRGRVIVLPAAASRRLFACLLERPARSGYTMLALLARAAVRARGATWRGPSCCIRGTAAWSGPASCCACAGTASGRWCWCTT